MTRGRMVIAGMLIFALAAGGALYYLQVYHFYSEVLAQNTEVQLTRASDGQIASLMFENFNGIDAESSPIRFRACYQLPQPLVELAGTFAAYPQAEPLNAPGWFDCFDAEAIGAALESGEAVAFLGVENIEYGVDRVVAVFPNGSAFSWDQLNICGETVFAGDPAPEGCPPPPEAYQ